MQEKIREKVKNIVEATKIGVSKDFSAEEKLEMFEHFERFSLSTATCRNRFFRDGWSEWELRGVIGCMTDYAKRSPEGSAFSIEAERFTLDDPVESIFPVIQDFYENLDKKTDFIAYMDELGMSSGTTVRHFKNPERFAAWEVFGIRRIMLA